MPATVIVGGQFGSEGKGKVAHYLAKTLSASYAVRCGGSNSGHTVIDNDGNPKIFRHLPTAAILPNIKLALCAGSYIDLEVLLKEIRETGITPDRLLIDPEAVIITNRCKEAEKKAGLIQNIGSTGSGTGVAVAERVLRSHSVIFAKSQDVLQPYIGNVSERLRESLSQNERIIIEGTQGFGLSPLHSGFYPKVTSRDTTASAFISEVGLSPLDVDDIAMVIRAFPIRVNGDSGPLPKETTWEEISLRGGFNHVISERTTVTNKIRRIGFFTPDIVKKSILANRPTKIFINHVDYVKNNITYDEAELFVKSIENQIGRSIDYIGSGPNELRRRHKIAKDLEGYSTRNVFIGADLAVY